ncbi:peptidase C15, pyroglutamyl peptidase I [Thraustotheca clavata]|uniref:Peptidase C15, pyroglutamyl peptidase I n=1 Tax=Thraustotheca clavata TaxID=74557 RepID=A0A1V9ZPS5_9STRA|nr:peptidase C15, pyroglutamyl peptidase I [Thraustotheca clavata]
MKIILTGFGKFGNIVENPTTKLAEQLKDDSNATVVHILEVSAEGLQETLRPYWEEAENSGNDTIFVHMGVNNGATEINLEQFGYNVADFRIPDERGWEPDNEPIVLDGPDNIMTTLPLESFVEKLGVNTKISTDPGRYICNYVYYKSLTMTSKHDNQHALFVHVPMFEVLGQDEQLKIIKQLLVLLHQVILTGFGKFYNILENPTTTLVELLKDDPFVTETRVIETSAVALKQVLQPLWEEAQATGEPTLFFHLGVDDSAEEVHFEKCAYNLADFCIPDEAGWEPQEQVILEGEPEVIYTALPIQELVEAIGMDCATSTDPGYYVCNYTYFLSLVNTRKHCTKQVGLWKIRHGGCHPTALLVKELELEVAEIHVLPVSGSGVRTTMAPLWAQADKRSEVTTFLHLGVNQEADCIRLEASAYNVADFPIPDEHGWQPHDQIILQGHDDVISTTLQVHKLAQELGERCIVSTDPGRFVCNCLYYLTLDHISNAKHEYALFVHVPSFDVISEEDQ